ncbi:hypothetical protein [Erythrobacter sp. THAF29]|uniref:hypothetical protein n=1 Tax=Erythrobacter sp. THAF29 TaxID=2587851 RepID=UPI0012697705|nr:hypothetical protein [Erythrobacter sp. THAF29]
MSFEWSSIFAVFAAVSLLALTAFASLSVAQKKGGREAGGADYRLFAWLAFACFLFFVFMAFATFEIRVIR